MKILFVSIILFISFTFGLMNNTSVCFALDSTPSAKIMEVDKISNVKDRLWEKITIFFKFSQNEKVNYQKYLAEKRLSELKFAIDNDKGDMIEETSSRYSTYIGNLTDDIMKNKMTNKKQELLTMMENHSLVLNSLINQIDVDSGFWLLLKHDINYVKIYSDQIKGL